MSGSETADGQGQVGGLSSQLAFLVPSFHPGEDDLQLYQQKVQRVLSMWPPNKILELTTRLAKGNSYLGVKVPGAENSSCAMYFGPQGQNTWRNSH